jgi:hypothetical protein
MNSSMVWTKSELSTVASTDNDVKMKGQSGRGLGRVSSSAG